MLSQRLHRVAEIARQIRLLTLEMEMLLLEGVEWEDAESADEAQEACASAHGIGALKRGATVVVLTKDQYRGRVGKVLGRRGKMFWRVELEAKGEKPQKEIYKLGKNLRVVAI
jgi:hypothetical protein